MLSRVAGRVYWMARYIERAENTARLVNAYNFLLLDLPRGTQLGWEQLSMITGAPELFQEHYQRHDERNTIKFLLADGFNPGSIVNSIASARENARTSREALPGQAWEQINELRLFADARLGEALPRRGRFEYLTGIIQRCQQLTGLLAGTMTHDHAYDFLRLGRNLERADMTTRAIDIGAMSLLQPDETGNIDVHVWTSVLHALNAYQMYRKDVQLAVQYTDVIHYLLQYTPLPRSVAHCLDQVEECITSLPRHRETLGQLREVRRYVTQQRPVKLRTDTLHRVVDRLQVGISAVHGRIHETWFE